MAEKRWVRVAALDEIPPGQVRSFYAGEQSVAVCRDVNGGLHAIEDVCTHDDGPLGEGELDGFAIECPRHGARFDVRTGEVLALPAVLPIRTFPVRTEGSDVLVEVEE